MLRAGAGDPAVLLAQFRLSAVLVPLWGAEAVWTADERGLRWILAFSSEEELAVFVRSKDLPLAGFPYLTVLGSRLLDVAVPGLGVPGGIALDVAGGEPMLLPPVRGIVPDEVALDGPVLTGGVGVGGRLRG
ncbi:SseB family protein [Kitasatospora sp. NPDC058190]|uniref:SseB family protein n=1 Tax=Kitasatospora sp. NPDC058190 TaxID=3346371 RepID=UPI0036DC8B9F